MAAWPATKPESLSPTRGDTPVRSTHACFPPAHPNTNTSAGRRVDLPSSGIMELVHGRHKTSKFAPEDFISNMPDNVITNILDRLPIQDAVRTDVLSKNWRFKWNMLSQLVFDEAFFVYLSKTKTKFNHVRIINRILLQLRGAITKFVLAMYDADDVEDANHWILFMSRRGIKDLTLDNIVDTPLELPNYLFSCLELKHLKLDNFNFNPPPSFLGFPNLLSLDLCLPDERSELGDFNKWPLLENLKLSILESRSRVKLVEIAKLENLKMLSLSLCDLDPRITSSSTIFELVGSLPKLQELDLDFQRCELTEDDATKTSLTTFPCLKVLKLSKIDLDVDNMLSCFFKMTRSFPNLQTLEITTWESRIRGPPCSL